PPPTLTSTLSLHDALPICVQPDGRDDVTPAPARDERGLVELVVAQLGQLAGEVGLPAPGQQQGVEQLGVARAISAGRHVSLPRRDRKSTRLNSSHVKISYA